MLDFTAHAFCQIIEVLDGLIEDYRKKQDGELTDAGAEHIVGIYETIIKECTNIDLSIAVEFINRTKHEINKGVSGAIVMERSKTIRTLIYQDLEKRRFLYVQNRKANILEKFNNDWHQVFGRFKTVKEDARAATEFMHLN